MHDEFFVTMVSKYCTAQFKLYTCVQAHACACMFSACKALNWHVQAMFNAILVRAHRPVNPRNTHHRLALGLPHYTCGVATNIVAVGNEMRLCCS